MEDLEINDYDVELRCCDPTYKICSIQI